MVANTNIKNRYGHDLRLIPYSYNSFSILLNILCGKILDTPDIRFGYQNNWYKSYPFYRTHYYKNIQVSQVMGIYFMFDKNFLSKFDTIIEIGTYNGGLSSWIFDNKNKDAKFVTYDIDVTVKSEKLNPKIDSRLEDCFSESTFKDIINFIKSDGKCLVLCDGGNKPKEFNEFSKYLKSGDHIMCHDYCKDKSQHNFSKTYWQWPYHADTFYEDIENSISKNNLEPYMHDNWQFFLWGSYVKK